MIDAEISKKLEQINMK